MWNLQVRVGLDRMDDVGKLDAVLNEEHRNVVADQVKGALIGVELHREASRVPHRIGRATGPDDRREADKTGVTVPSSPRKAAFVTDCRPVRLKDTVRCSTPGVHDPLGNALVIEVSDLLAQMEVLEQRRSAAHRL